MRHIDWDLCTEYLAVDTEVLREVKASWERLCLLLSGTIESPGQKLEAILAQLEQAVADRDEDRAWEIAQRGQHLCDDYPWIKDMFPIVWIAYVLPATLGMCTKLGIPDPVVRETLYDFSRWLKVFRDMHALAIGFAKGKWFIHHLCCNLVQLGGLQYQSTVHEHPFELYRNASSGQWICMALAGLDVDMTGHIAGTNGLVSRTWQTWRKDNDLSFIGFCVDLRLGIVQPVPVSLSRESLVLQAGPGQRMLHVHIPAGAVFTQEAVSESIMKCRAFLPRLGFPVDVIECDSWLLDPALEEILPSNGNICSFMRRFAKFPIYREVPQLFDRVFGPDFTLDKLDSWQCITSLQRKLRDYLLAGKQVYTTGGFLAQA